MRLRQGVSFAVATLALAVVSTASITSVALVGWSSYGPGVVEASGQQSTPLAQVRPPTVEAFGLTPGRRAYVQEQEAQAVAEAAGRVDPAAGAPVPAPAPADLPEPPLDLLLLDGVLQLEQVTATTTVEPDQSPGGEPTDTLNTSPTDGPTTSAPTTSAPVTDAPVTDGPTTDAPVTDAPSSGVGPTVFKETVDAVPSPTVQSTPTPGTIAAGGTPTPFDPDAAPERPTQAPGPTEPTAEPTTEPTAEPTIEPTAEPTTAEPTTEPTAEPVEPVEPVPAPAQAAPPPRPTSQP